MLDNKENIQPLLHNLFEPESYDPNQKLQILNEKGGISYLLNNLNVSHRQGLSDYHDHTKRREIYGSNQKPPGESLLRKSLYEQRDFLVNLLLYVLTLKIGIKILLWQKDIESELVSSIWREIIGLTLLFVIIYLKAMVNVNYSKMDKDERNYKNEWVRVRRDGQDCYIQEKDLLVGDIIVVDRSCIIRVDGIILDIKKKILVSEVHTILRKDATSKKADWGEDSRIVNSNQDKDPFILAGSEIVSGNAEILVCTVGENCSFRRNHESSQGIYEETPVIVQTKNILNYVEYFARFFGICIAFYCAAQFLIKEHVIVEPIIIDGVKQSYYTMTKLRWSDFNHILRIFASFLGTICLLQRLKIGRSLKFFIEENKSGTYFLVKNRQTIEKLSEADIIILQESTIEKTTTQVRDQLITYIPNIGVLSHINTFYNLKIITNSTERQIYSTYGNDIRSQQIFVDSANYTSEEKMQRLMDSTFLTECSVTRLIEQYLPIYISLGYKIAYLSNAENHQNSNFPEELLHITFQRVGAKTERCIQESWVKLQNKTMMESILEELVHKSFQFAKLHNVYMSLFANNLVVFVFLCWNSVKAGEEFDLSWTLTIIIVNRVTFFYIYGRIAKGKSFKKFSERSAVEVLKFNLFPIPFYFYMMSLVEHQNNIFLLFLANSIFRVQALLFKTNQEKPLRYWIMILGIGIGINFVNFIFDNGGEDFLSLIFTISLAVIYSIYVFIA